MFGKYKVVHLVGSTRGNEDIFKFVEEKLIRLGYIVFRPTFYNVKQYDECKEMLDDMCYEKLLISDIICIVSHIGDSTINRINQARELGKEVMMWNGSMMIKFV
jgi:hypothetical protein